MKHQHNFKTVNDNDDGRLEVCTECHFRLTTKKDPRTGRIDNKKYVKEHTRDLAQPYGRTRKVFIKHYGDSAEYISRFKK